MKEAHVGFYVHYHGLGHKHRTEAILQHLTLSATIITSRIDSLQWSGPTLRKVIGIACDNENLSECGLRHAGDVPSLHFAPLWSPNITSRAAAYLSWLAETQPALMVVDVSVEISMLTRLAAIPQIVMRQHGDRSDPAHLNAYAAAHSLLAPFPSMMEDDITADWVRKKTVYLDGFCRTKSDNQDLSAKTASSKTVVFLFGRGGTDDVHEQLRQAATQLVDYDVLVLGKERPADDVRHPDNLRYLGWVSDPSSFIADADVVVTAAGHNSVMELGDARKQFVAIAESRSFAEQIRKAEVLQREQLAIGLSQWPDSKQWSSIIASAKQIDVSKWDQVFAGNGAEQAADHICQVALSSHKQSQRPKEISL